MRANDHLTVGVTQHVKVGTGQFVEAGTEIHYHAGDKVVIEGGMELTAKAGGSFVKVDAGGVTISGAEVKANTGGAPGVGSGIAILPPVIPWIADSDKAGQRLTAATAATAPRISAVELKKARIQRQDRQARSLKQAAEDGKPFCEICSK
jgi:type VI secretion system secreted protein VgrG